jgi:dienelactone hydrolase
VVIDTDCIGSCKSNYHTITTTSSLSWVCYGGKLAVMSVCYGGKLAVMYVCYGGKLAVMYVCYGGKLAVMYVC